MIESTRLDARRYAFPGSSLSTRLINVVDPEVLRDRLELEAFRHARYLSGFGLVRLRSFDEEARSALEEAAVTETRCTDAVALLLDATLAVLVTNADEDACRTVASRLLDVACELLGDPYARQRFVVGMAAAGQRRLGADEVWDEAARALANAVRLQS